MFRILCHCADQAPSTDAPTWRSRANRLFLVRLARPGPDRTLTFVRARTGRHASEIRLPVRAGEAQREAVSDVGTHPCFCRPEASRLRVRTIAWCTPAGSRLLFSFRDLATPGSGSAGAGWRRIPRHSAKRVIEPAPRHWKQARFAVRDKTAWRRAFRIDQSDRLPPSRTSCTPRGASRVANTLTAPEGYALAHPSRMSWIAWHS